MNLINNNEGIQSIDSNIINYKKEEINIIKVNVGNLFKNNVISNFNQFFEK